MMSGDASGNIGSTSDIENPIGADVLCGRGRSSLHHPGNQTYRQLVNSNKGLYVTCMTAEKMKISRSIVAAIREQNGRFLEKDPEKGTWYDIGDKKAIEKTSQALREGQPKLKQKIVELGGGAAGASALLESQFLRGGSANQHLEKRHDAKLTNTGGTARIYEDPINARSINRHETNSAPEQLSLDPERKISLLSMNSDFTVDMDTPGSLMSIPSAPYHLDTPNSCTSGADVSMASTTNSSGKNMDLRTHFARMKYNRPPSGRVSQSGDSHATTSYGDAFPDFHPVESSPSLLSNISAPSASSRVPGDVASELESRLSLMSGLSRISDDSDAPSIISDLSRKIGNVSTRSVAMSEISAIENDEQHPGTMKAS